MTNAPVPPLLAPNRPPLLAVLLPKRPLAEDAPVPVAAGAPVGTISDQKISGVNIVRENNSYIKPLLSQSQL